MEKWRERLIEAIQNDGRSLRAISLDAGLGPNYVNQLIAPNSRGPTAEKLIKLLNTLRVSPTYIITGSPMTADFEELLRLASQMKPETRQKLIDYLRSEADTEPALRPPSADEAADGTTDG